MQLREWPRRANFTEIRRQPRTLPIDAVARRALSFTFEDRRPSRRVATPSPSERRRAAGSPFRRQPTTPPTGIRQLCGGWSCRESRFECFDDVGTMWRVETARATGRCRPRRRHFARGSRRMWTETRASRSRCPPACAVPQPKRRQCLRRRRRRTQIRTIGHADHQL